ncbi:MAG: hypothetical protein V3V03_04895 [Hyphomonadaceae bacterium]
MKESFSMADNESLIILGGEGPQRMFRVENASSSPLMIDDPTGGREMTVAGGKVGYYSGKNIAFEARSGAVKGTFTFIA